MLSEYCQDISLTPIIDRRQQSIASTPPVLSLDMGITISPYNGLDPGYEFKKSEVGAEADGRCNSGQPLL